MPKCARYTLAWLAKDDCYELRKREGETHYRLQMDDNQWPIWLAEHASFSFQGKQGHLSLLKETRARGTGYWYAYRNLNRCTRKLYAGRTVDLTIAHLEELAEAFTQKAASSSPNKNTLTSPSELPSPALHDAPAEPSPQQPVGPLLEPKLRLPRIPATQIERERLFTILDAALERNLTLLCAPAGFGKTTLACQWLNARRIQAQCSPVAWISLDTRDNDPILFWRYIITACQNFHADIGHTLFEQLSVGLPPSLELPSLEQLLTPLLNELMHIAHSGLLILEDYHLITEARIHETMVFFLEHLPATIHVMMLTRHEPPFPLIRWRARGELCEVQATDLRFSQEETIRFFRRTLPSESVLFSTEDLQQMHERVEGWAAGLRLLALTLQGRISHQGLTRALTHFAGEQHSLQKYFVTEVLNAQPKKFQDFLLQTSILDRLTGGLCDFVATCHDSERILEDIEHAGLFLEALDGSGKWYRYHALFAEAMQAEARRRLSADTLRTLYRRASKWYTRQNMLTKAIEATFQAQDIRQAAALIEQLLEKPATFLFGTQLFQHAPQFHTLRRWLEQLPEEVLRSHPLLCLGYAASLVFVSVQEQSTPSPETIVRLFGTLQLAEEGWRYEGNLARLGEVYAFRAMILRQPGAIGEAMSYARQSLALLPLDALESRGMVLWLIGMGEIQEGHFHAARETFLKVRAFCEALGNAGIMRANTGWLSKVYFAQGELHQTGMLLRQLLAEARAMEDIDDICDALLGLAQLAYVWNELANAEKQAQEALELAHQLANEELQVQATLLLARIDQAHGLTPAARQRCSELLARLSPTLPLRSQLVREICAMQAQLALIQGDLATVERWWNSLTEPIQLPLALREYENLLRARWLLAQGQAESALKLLHDWQDDAQKEGRIARAWEGQLLMAQAYATLKNAPLARKLLRDVLEGVYIEGNVRLFLDEGEALATLLQTLLPIVQNSAQRAFLRRLLFAFAQEQTAHGQQPSYSLVAQPLSKQEQRVLHLLTVGHTNPEIAHELVISLNTAKTHVQSIYRKLNVTNRVEACEVARILKLL
ncbi:MAG: hypothetical protein JO031_18250 [Ktedonobacteraceae bacterium]|nr:hypothetical protein [Ktedonobacteraceae bacterium]